VTDPQVAILMLALFVGAIFLGFPIAFTLMAMGVAFGYYAYFDADRMWRTYHRAVESGADTWTLIETWVAGFFNNRIFDLFINQTFSVMANDVLTAVPLFLFMGYIVERANIVSRLFATLSIATRHVPGSMGVAALIVAFALSNGFRDEMREKILQGTAHLSVLRADGRPIENHAELAQRLREVAGVVSASATTYDGALARGSKDSGYAVIRGIENEGGQFAQARQWLTEGSFGPLFETSSTGVPNAVVGADLAAQIGLALNDVFQVQPAKESTPRRLRVGRDVADRPARRRSVVAIRSRLVDGIAAHPAALREPQWRLAGGRAE